MSKIELLENEFLDSNNKIVHLNDILKQYVYKELNVIFLGIEGVEKGIISLESLKEKVRTLLKDLEK